MTSKHSPGPWTCTYTSNHAHDYRLSRPRGPLPLTAIANDHSEQRANARLIAAAPDMLAALNYEADMSYVDADGKIQKKEGYNPQICLDAIAKAGASNV